MTHPHDPHQSGGGPPQEPPVGPSPHQGPYGAQQPPPVPPYAYGYPPQGPPPPGHPPPQDPPPGYPPFGYPAQEPPSKRGGALPWVIGGGLLGLLLLGAAGFALRGLVGAEAPEPGAGAAAGSGLEDVRLFEDLSKEHVPTGEAVDYEQFPPVGGEHYSFWQNCGVYDEPVLTEAAVHSLEHGAVWITHDPELDPAQVERLVAHHEPGSYVLVSPMEGLPSPIVASAWGAQLQLEDASDERIDAFLREYEQSPNAPEPGAPCSGAYDGTEAEAEAEGVNARVN